MTIFINLQFFCVVISSLLFSSFQNCPPAVESSSTSYETDQKCYHGNDHHGRVHIRVELMSGIGDQSVRDDVIRPEMTSLYVCTPIHHMYEYMYI